MSIAVLQVLPRAQRSTVFRCTRWRGIPRSLASIRPTHAKTSAGRLRGTEKRLDVKRTYTTDLCSVRLARPFLPLLAENPHGSQALATWLECVDDDARVPASAAYDWLEQTTLATGDDTLGLRAAKLESIDTSSVLSHAVRSAPTFAAALDLAGRYAQLLNDDLSLSLRAGADRAEVHFQSRLGAPRALLDLQLCALVERLRPVAPSGFLGELEASFYYETPRERAMHEQALGQTRTHFSAEYTGLSFPSVYLDAASKRPGTPEPTLIVSSITDLAPLPARAALGFAAEIRHLVVQELPHTPLSAALLARKTGESVHNLARRLHEEKTTFAAVVDDVRRTLADHYLRNKGMTIVDTALLTGFAQIPAFNRAFQRWTGAAPSAHRRNPETLGSLGSSGATWR